MGQKTEGFEKWLNSKLSGKFPVQKRKVSLKLTEINEEFYIVASNELYDVMTGGAFNFVGQQEQEAYKKWLEQVQK